MNLSLIRTQTAYLTNKSGGLLVQGAVGIIDSANSNSFKTTTTPGYTDGLVCVVLEPAGIANNATGLVCVGGYVPMINLSASASLGDLFATHTVAGQAAPHAAPLATGDIGMVLDTGTTPPAIIYPAPSYVPTSLGRTLLDQATPTGTGNVNFATIPDTYAKLTLEYAIRSTQAAIAVDGYMQFNGDTTAGNYRFQEIRANAFGSGLTNGALYKFSGLTTIPAASAPANEFAIGKTEIMQYANPNVYKHALTHLGMAYDASSVFLQVAMVDLSWKDLTPIDEIDITLELGDYASNSIISLYGEN